MFTNPETGEAYKTGELMKRPALAETLRTIAKSEDGFYRGDLAKAIVEDLQKIGAVITEEDLSNYKFEALMIFSNIFWCMIVSAEQFGMLQLRLFSRMQGLCHTPAPLPQVEQF